MRGKILIVEDEKKLAEVMKLYLQKEGYETDCVYSGGEGERYIKENEYDLIILDIMMPGKDGWSLLRNIKAKGSTPVILTTARGEEEDRIFGFELGADDYMIKPISLRELVLRVNLRMKITVQKSEKLQFDGLSIDEDRREVKENGLMVALTPKEFDLLVFLCKNHNQVFKRDQLLDKVWGYDFMGDTRTVDTHVKNLREKLKYCGENLKTLWRVGYKMEARNG